MFNIKNLFKKSKWSVRYYVERHIHWQDRDIKETITFFLKTDQFGNRKYDHQSYGFCETFDAHKSYEAEMILWKEVGILPKGAKDVIVEKLTNA